MNSLERILVVTSVDEHWLWLSDAIGERYILVRENGNFESMAQRVGLVSPAAAIVDFSPQVVMQPDVVVQELNSLNAQLPVIALGNKQASDTLVAALRVGVKDFVDLNNAPEEVLKLVDTVMERAPSVSTKSHGNAVAVLGARPGSGATTFSVNLCAQLRKAGKDDALLLDFGFPLGDGQIHLPCEEKQGAMDFVECVRNLRRFDASLARTAFKRHAKTDIALLALPRNLADLRDVSAQDAVKFLNLIKSFFGHLVMDLCGFNNVDFVSNVARIADTIIIVVQQSVPSVVSAAELMKAMGDRGVSPDRFVLVVNQYDPTINLSPQAMAERLKIKRTYTLPPRRATLVNAVNAGMVLSDADTKDAYSKAVSEVIRGCGIGQAAESESALVMPEVLKKWLKR